MSSIIRVAQNSQIKITLILEKISYESIYCFLFCIEYK